MKTHKGYALVSMVIIVLAALTVSMSAMLKWATSGYRAAINRTERTRLLYAADGGIQYALASFKSRKVVPEKEVNDSIVSSFFSQVSAMLPSGMAMRDFTIISNNGQVVTVKSAVYDLEDPDNWVEIHCNIDWQFKSLFDWGIFYDSDCEIHSARPLFFSGGVHVNGDLYVSCFQNQTMHFDSLVTVAGDILHDRKEGPWSDGGNVYFKDNDGIFQPMKIYGIWLDSNHPFWLNGSQLRWDGNVLSGDHGVQRMDIPIPGAETDPHLIVELPDELDTPEESGAKYANIATLKIMPDGNLYGVFDTESGYSEQLIDCATNMPWISADASFWNGRQKYSINPLDIDVAAFKTWLEAEGPGPFLEDEERGGVLYVALQDVEGRAVRLVNGEEVPGDGLTVVTPNPLYVQGNYNTINKKPASLISDSLTYLSVDWDDAKNVTHNNGKARDSRLNAAVITGHVPSTPGLYSGGVENLIRLLENWGAQRFTFSGALVSIWASQQETTNYDELGPADVYYTPPERIWGYENLFANPGTLPPGTPGILKFGTSGWKRVH
jgi:hypothetical protein